MRTISYSCACKNNEYCIEMSDSDNSKDSDLILLVRKGMKRLITEDDDSGKKMNNGPTVSKYSETPGTKACF